MVYLVAAVVAVAALCLFNLTLTFGLIRRQRAGWVSLDQQLVLGAGERVGSFAATTVDGTSLRDRDLAAGVVVGFFAPGCQPCAELLPVFTDRARQVPGSVAVLSGSDEALGQYLSELIPVGRVVVEATDGPVASAFRVRSYPALVVLDERQRVRGSGVTAAVLASSPPATAVR